MQEQVYEELFEIFGTSNRNATKNDLNQMLALDRVIKETLRLYPSVPYMSRKLEKDLVISKEFNLEITYTLKLCVISFVKILCYHVEFKIKVTRHAAEIKGL